MAWGSPENVVVSSEASVGRVAVTVTDSAAAVADATKDEVPEKAQVRKMALMSAWAVSVVWSVSSAGRSQSIWG